jgi:hypothetical protein
MQARRAALWCSAKITFPERRQLLFSDLELGCGSMAIASRSQSALDKAVDS